MANIATRQVSSNEEQRRRATGSNVIRLFVSEPATQSRGVTTSEIDALVQRVGDLMSLEPGWDGEGAAPPERADLLLALMAGIELLKTVRPKVNLTAAPDGSLLYTLFRGGRELELWIEPGCDQMFYSAEEPEHPVQEGEVSLGELSPVAEWLRDGQTRITS